MATLTDYKGLDVVESATGDGGIALTDNFKELADRAPYAASANPTTSSDSSAGFAPGDQWLNTSSKTMFVCVSASAGAAVWKSFFNRSSTALQLIPSESSEKVEVLGNLQVDGTGSSSIAGSLGIATTSPACPVHVVNTGNTTPCLIADNDRTTFDILEMRVSGTKRGAISKNGGGGLEFNTVSTRDISLMPGSSKMGVGTTSPTGLLDVNSDTLRLRTSKTPSSASATGNAGDICWDSNYVYICVATNTWKRSAISTW